MKIQTCQTGNEAARFVVQRLKDLAGQNPLRLFTPTGQTPQEVYKLLAADFAYWQKRIKPIQIDEFIQPEGIFLKQLSLNLLDPLKIDAQKIDPGWTDSQMGSHIERVLSAPIDVAFLGLGPNGHVGFHEPGDLSQSFLGGRVQVSEETKSRVAGAKTNQVYTFGVGAFLKAREVVLLVTGQAKRHVLKAVLQSEPTSRIPASLLKTHPHLTVVTDKDAY